MGTATMAPRRRGLACRAMTDSMKPRSYEVTDGYQRAPARAMLRAVGMTDDDWDKPQVGIASSWNEVTPCNMPLDRLAKRSKEGVRAAGGFPLEFTTIAISDGISMGHEGMRASAGEPGDHRRLRRVRHARRALRRARRPGRLRQVAARHAHGRRPPQPAERVPLRRVDPARQPQRHAARHRVGLRGRRRLRGRHHRRATSSRRSRTRPAPPRAPAPACSPPTPWRRSARRSACALPGSASAPAVDRRRDDFARASGVAVMKLLEAGIRPRQILTKGAFENAIAVTMALGGSTNAVLHLLAIAYEAQVELELDDFNKVAARVPHIADMKPHGRYHMTDLDRVGGVPVVMKAAGRAGPAPPRRDHGHRPDGGREPRRSSRRPAPTARSCTRWTRPAPRGRRPRRAAGLAGPAGLGGQGGRHRLRALRGHGPGLRRRAGRARGDPGRPHQPRRRRRDPLRGPQGRARHAGDAGHHRRHEGRRAGRRRRPRHRRPLLRRHPRLLRRPRRPRGGRRRADRASSTRATASASTWRDHTDRPAGRRRPSSARRQANWKPLEPRYTSGVLAKYARLAQGAEKGAITEA